MANIILILVRRVRLIGNKYYIPFSLLNNYCKIFTVTLISRMKKMQQNFMQEFQCGFSLLKRHLSDNVRRVLDLLEYCDKRIVRQIASIF